MSASGDVVVSLSGVQKRFGGVVALSDVDLELERGRTHAFVGQNGAGKSTCLGVLAGRISASAGAVRVGRRVYPATMTPAVARAHGVSAIYQELAVVGSMSALDNALLGAMPSRSGWVDRRAMLARFADLSATFGVHIGPDARAGDLSVADQQLLEIMRALSVDCDVLLMDEPTAALAPPERAALFRVVDRLRSTGVTTVLVSHNLDEVLEHCDSITVFRDGRVVERAPVAIWDKPKLVRAMLGTELDALRRATTHRATGQARASGTGEVLRVAGLTSPGGIHDIDLVVRAGEIVGLGGLVGSGRSALVRALAGVDRAVRGRMWMCGREIPVARTPRQAQRHRIGLVPDDRKRAGLIPRLSSVENILLGRLGRHAWAGFVRNAAARRRARELGDEYGLPAAMLDQPAGELSGGNQQKLLLARMGGRELALLLADEPTRGIDIGAKAVVLDTLRRLADRGLGVLLVSSDLEEVVAASDRVYVLREGRIVAHLDRETGIDEDLILSHAFGLAVADRA